MMNPILQVALGGALGSVSRYGVNRAAAVWVGTGFPAGTFAVNVAGSFLMGLLSVVLARHAAGAGPLLLTGGIGGFTTFSAFSLDAVTLWDRGLPGTAAAYVAATLILSLAALAAGLALGRSV